MADTKISGLTTLTGAASAAGDLIPIVDIDAAETKKITKAELAVGLLPVPDSTPLVTFGTDKEMRIDVGAVADSTVRVLIMPNQDIDLNPSSGDFAAALGVDDNYVTDAEKTVVGNTSGTNTGDQTIGLVSLSNTSITVTTNIDITGFVPGTYDNYEVCISYAKPNLNGAILVLETSTDGGSNYDVGGSDYTWAAHSVLEDGTVGSSGLADDDEIRVSGTIATGNATEEQLSYHISVFLPDASVHTAFSWIGNSAGIDAGKLTTISGSGRRQAVADVNGLRFLWSSGEYRAQGKIQLLGMAQ